MKDIDLHGVKHEDVGTLLDNFIWDCMKANATSADIITGNSSEMKRIVREAVAEYGYTTQDSLTNNGMLILNLL
jgi:DNA-nicking Smr family endonuclease